MRTVDEARTLYPDLDQRLATAFGLLERLGREKREKREAEAQAKAPTKKAA